MDREHPSKTRVVGYRFAGEFDESVVEKLLETALKRKVVTQYDTGRGSFVWFNGPPGAPLREVRDQVLALIPNAVPVLDNRS